MGGAISRVAVSHLFSVYPELRAPAKLCSESKGNECFPQHANILERYGVIRTDRRIAGGMMELGVKLALIPDGDEVSSPGVGGVAEISASELGEWAEELAAVGRRRNVLEKKLRSVVVNMLRFDSLANKDKASAKDRVLNAVNENRRKQLTHFGLDVLVEKLFWPELIALAGREWSVFERVFGAKDRFTQAAEIINDRPDAHAKSYDAADFALYRRSLTMIEDALRTLD